MPLYMMPKGTRALLQWMKERADRQRRMLERRVAYGGRKGRSAARRLRRMTPGLWDNPERIIAGLYGPEWARDARCERRDQ